ncbi:MAG: ABC transporter ATP-binding protein [Clostridia bacterium]|nr:ABC transporter ATP-binding protein [Clostridia bacterium]
MAEKQQIKKNGPPPPGGPGGRMKFEKPNDAKKTLSRLLGYVVKNKSLLVLVAFLVIVSSGAGVAGTYLLTPIIDEIGAVVKDGSLDVTNIVKYLLIIGVIYVCGTAAQYIYQRLMLNIAQGTLNLLRKDLFDHLQSLPIKFFDTHTHGELMSRFTNDTDTIREAISQGLVQVISSLVSVVGIFVMMLYISPALTGLIILMLFVMLNIIKFIGGKSANFFRKQQQNIGAVNGYIEEFIEGQRVVKVFCREEKSKENFAVRNENFRKSATNAHTCASIIMPIMGNLSYFNFAATAALGAFIIIKFGATELTGASALLLGGIEGTLTIGSLAAFLQYTRQFSNPISQVSQQLNSILAALAGAERIFAIIDTKPEEDDGYVTLVNANVDENGNITESEKRTGKWAWRHPHSADGSVTYTLLKGDVRFNDVTFSYDGKKTVLKNVSLYAKPGQKIAFVGSTGAGKTTITNLINRFYDIDEGKITYDGINIKKIKKDDLRRSLAMVLQDTHLFTGTVEENIRYGKLDATHEEIVEAAKLSNAHSFIKRLPDGYNTKLSGDGSNLSQGQRQLLAIARAAVADPPVLILDEATSSIDTRTEKLIEKGMDKLMENKTVFVIAHRLSTVRNSNAIMVLEDGQIIEKGDHDTLIEEKGKYYKLYTGQFELS